MKTFLCCFLLSFGAFAQFGKIEHYRKSFGVGSYQGREVAVIRAYDSDGVPFYAAIGFEDLQTRLIPAQALVPKTQTWEQILAAYRNTPYIRAIDSARLRDLPLQDAGIAHGDSHEKGVALTIDLCPSHRGLDRVIFTTVARAFQKLKKPQPIGLSITGKFLESHPADIAWLRQLQQSGAIDIVWINHTFNHRYDPKLPLAQNFLLKKNTNLDTEILLLEQRLLEQGIVFSPFFRFPGLVSDRALVDTVTQYGLIPIGSDAWLAKGQTAHNGDIVLIHGNGNEPLGVRDFLALLKNEQKAIDSGHWLLYDLREDLEGEFSTKN